MQRFSRVEAQQIKVMTLCLKLPLALTPIEDSVSAVEKPFKLQQLFEIVDGFGCCPEYITSSDSFISLSVWTISDGPLEVNCFRTENDKCASAQIQKDCF